MCCADAAPEREQEEEEEVAEYPHVLNMVQHSPTLQGNDFSDQMHLTTAQAVQLTG